MKKAVILLTRVPFPGQTKTRMMPWLSGKECAVLHCCFLQDIMAEIRKTGADLFVCYKEPDIEEEKRNAALQHLQKIAGSKAQCWPQQGQDLGERMYLALAEVLGKGYDACLLVGADIPELTARQLTDAFRLLEKEDVVLGPTTDGGYYLIGMKKPQWGLFEGQTYSHPMVLSNALEAARKSDLRAGLVGTLSDVDVPEDLKQLRRRVKMLRKGTWTETDAGQQTWKLADLKQKKTVRFLEQHETISVIIPIYNEEKTITALQKQLKPWQEQCEILLVDGGSTDQTLKLIDPSFQVIRSPKGRACQMNRGAAESQGDILLFLHCDSNLPPDFITEIRRVMCRHRAGCFGIRFSTEDILMRVCGMMSNYRAKVGGIPFGDQGIFLERELFFEMGGFPEIPIMEDYQFSMTMKKQGIRFGMTAKRIVTSDRRFPKGVFPKLCLMWKMNRLRKQYRDGVSIDKIAAEYKDIR